MCQRAEALLDRGELREARALLEARLQREPRDVGALTLLGRVHLAWPVVGRWQALRLLRRAAEVAPNDPDPWYWKIRVGQYLGSADGESLMRSGLLGVLERAPRHRDVWEYWDGVYRDPHFLLSAADVLARHDDDPGIAIQRARLLVEAAAYAEADAAIAALPSAALEDGGVWALKAQGALERGDTVDGLVWYDAAVRGAARDSLQILWRQVAPIAWPDEDSIYATLEPDERPAFFRAFWARREPDLNTVPNERIVEHFSRLRTARARYRLLHPQSRFHYSLERRAILGSQSGRVLQAIQQDFDFFVSGVVPGRSRFEDIIQGAGLGVDVRDLPEPDSVTRYRRHGFDGRGLIYLRFGEPAGQLVSSAYGVEAWDYDVNGTRSRVVFARASTDGGGDMVLFPTSQVELHNSAIMLERDASSLAANTDLYAWVAFFRGGLQGEQLAYVGVNADTSAAAVWDQAWIETQRSRARGPHVFTLARGPYVLGIDAVDGDQRGRIRAEIEVPNLWRGTLSLSSLLIGAGVDTTAYTRDEVARAMPGDRRFRTGQPLALYAEVYGLSSDREGRSRFQVQYTFEPEDGGRLVSLSYDRNASASDVVLERVVAQPGRIPAGRYRVRLTVWDQVRRRMTQSTFVPFELH